MIYIGCHLSVTNGYAAMGETMVGFGGNTFAFVTRNPRGGKSKDLLPEDAAALLELLDWEQFGPLVAHGSYTMNLCAAKPETRANGLDMLKKDLARMEALPGNYYNFHPGSHVGQGAETGIELIAEALNQNLWPEMQTTVLLETMAGKGSEMGSTFEELREIIDRVVGLERLHAIHLNDSKNPLGSHKDRHEKLGLGHLGEDALKRIVTHPALQGKPFILETPNDDAGYIQEIRMVQEWM